MRTTSLLCKICSCFLLLSSALPFRTGFVTQLVTAGLKLHVRYRLKHTIQWHIEDRVQGISRGHSEFFFWHRDANFSVVCKKNKHFTFCKCRLRIFRSYSA